MMNDHGKSDSPIEPRKSPNKTDKAAAAGVEGRGMGKGGRRGGATRSNPPGPVRSAAAGGVPSTAGPASVHTEVGRRTAADRTSGTGRQDRREIRLRGAGRRIRPGALRILVRGPAGARPESGAGR